MKRKHVKYLFQDWLENKLDVQNRKKVEVHLEDCEACRMYYKQLSTIINQPELSSLKDLQPDPYLPTRIKSVLDKEISDDSYFKSFHLLRWIITTGVLIVAFGMGIFLGNELYTSFRKQVENELISAYYEALSQDTISDRFTYFVDMQEEE